MNRTLRVLVTGQLPRPDVEAQFALEAPGVEFRLAGALDGMSRADIKGSTRRCSDADILPAKLASGETTPVARGLVADRLSARLQTRDPTLLWSTASFLTLPRYDDVVRPADLLTAMIDVLLPAGTLGIIVPSRQQLDGKIKERTRPGVRVVAATVAPQSDNAAIDDAACQLPVGKTRSRAPGLHVLHAIGAGTGIRDPALPRSAAGCRRGSGSSSLVLRLPRGFTGLNGCLG